MILEVRLIGGPLDGFTKLRRSVPPRIAWVSERDVAADLLRLYRTPARGRTVYLWKGPILTNAGGQAPCVTLEYGGRDAMVCAECASLTRGHPTCLVCGGKLLPASIPVTA